MSRRGVSLAEALVALLLGFLVLHLALSTLARVRTAQRRLADQADLLVTQRVSRHVLRRELRHGDPDRDWVVHQDSLTLRAFRGTALVCPSDSASHELTVSYVGDRRPDPTKDSLLLLDELGAVTVRALQSTGSAPGPCGTVAGDSLEQWRLDASAPPRTVLARLFERGSYHLAGAALRYRRGSSGRQPLTPEVLSPVTGWSTSGDALRVTLVPREAGSGRRWSGFLARMGSP